MKRLHMLHEIMKIGRAAEHPRVFFKNDVFVLESRAGFLYVYIVRGEHKFKRAVIDTFFENLKRYYRENCKEKSFSILYDLSNFSSIPGGFVQQFALRMHKLRHETEKRVICTPIVTSSVLIKSVLVPVLWIYKSACPVRVFDTVVDAEEFMRKEKNKLQTENATWRTF